MSGQNSAPVRRFLYRMPSSKPLIGIVADRRMLGRHPFHCVGEKYILAVAEGADAVPLLIPALGSSLAADPLLDVLHGVLLTGSASNVEPHHYAGPASAPGTLHDPHRDATVLPLIRRWVNEGIPLLGICRGFQEMNVAFGGTLWQQLHEVEGHCDHREDPEAELDVQYGPAHDVELTPGGWLHRFAGVTRVQVNSLHEQGVQQLAPGLIVEARAPDGVIEAFRVADAASFALAVQWHPEWKFQDNRLSRALFAAFGEAARARALRRS
jgi:putative glutamine amidotransferase